MKQLVIAALAVLGLAVAVAPVSAQPYPNRTVTIIVPYSAGGPVDQLARQIADRAGGETQAEFRRRERDRRQHRSPAPTKSFTRRQTATRC